MVLLDITSRNRRRVSAALAALAISVSLAACASAGTAQPTSSTPIKLNVWSFNDLSKETALYNSTHKGVVVTDLKVPGDGYIPKLLASIKAGNAPDVAQVVYESLPTLESAGGLVDISKYGANDAKSKFVPWTWNQVSRGSGVYAIPQDSGPMAMAYRTDVFSKLNLTPPKTWAEYAEDAAKIHTANPDMYITAFSPGDSAHTVALAWQAGARWFKTQGDSWVVNIDDAATNKVADYWQGLLDNKQIKVEPFFSTGWNSDLQTGNTATWLTAAWGPGVIASAAPDAKGLWAVAPLPQWDSAHPVSANWGGSSMAVTTSSKHAKEATDFDVWLNSDPASVALLIKANGLFPAANSASNAPGFNDADPYYGGQKVNTLYASVSKTVDTGWKWGPTTPQMFTSVSDEMGKVTNGDETFRQAFQAVQSATVAAMKSQGLSVK